MWVKPARTSCGKPETLQLQSIDDEAQVKLKEPSAAAAGGGDRSALWILPLCCLQMLSGIWPL